MLHEIKKKENLSKSIVRALGEYILSNNLKNGDRLPTEMELVNHFKVARTVVREALQAMAIIGIISSKPGAGSVLTSNGIEPFLLPFVFGVALEGVGFNKLGELRLIVEQGAIRLAIKNASEKELLIVMGMARELDNIKAKTYADLSEENQTILALKETEFHQYLVNISHNPILKKFGSLWHIFFTRVQQNQSFKETSKSYKNKTMPAAQHTEIVSALLERDEAKALTAIEDHLAYWLMQDQLVAKDELIDLISKE